MALFPAFHARSQPGENRASFIPKTVDVRSDPDVEVLGSIPTTVVVSLPSFSFDADEYADGSVILRQGAPSEPEVKDAFAFDDIVSPRNPGHQKRKNDKHRKSKKRKQEEPRYEQQELRHSAEPDFLRNNPKLVFLKDTGLPPEHGFCYDENPDRNNFAFEETYWKNVPKFRRPRWNLGMQGGKTGRKVMDMRYFNAERELRILKCCRGKSIGVCDEVEPFGRNYLPFPSEGVSVEVELEAELPSESDHLKQRTTSFNEKLRQDPTNIPMWLEFLRFQDDVAGEVFTASEKKDVDTDTGTASEGLMVRKIAIIEKAIENNPSNLLLQIRRLNMAEEIWDKDTLSSEWRKLAFNHPNDPYIWTSYLDFRKSYFSLFQVSRLTKVFQKYISTARSISDGTFKSHSAVPGHMYHMAQLASYFSTFWMQSGHQEKSIAYFQALLELNLNFPKSLDDSMPIKDTLVFFEPFWDSGAPRLADKSSVGWANVMGAKSESVPEKEPCTIDEEENTVIKTSSSSADLWMMLERFRQERFLLPCAGADDPLDPERIVLFDDISSLLFRIKREDVHILLSVLLNFLTVLRCPLLRRASTKSYLWRSGVQSLLEYPMASLVLSFGESHEFTSSADSYAETFFQPFSRTWTDHHSVITQVFEQSIDRFEGLTNSYLCISWIQFALYKFVIAAPAQKVFAAKDVRALARTLLKRPENRNNLLVWEWYAFAEGVIEGSEDAVLKILETVLNFTILNMDDVTQVWLVSRIVRYYATSLMEITSGKRMGLTEKSTKQRALSVLVQFSEGGKIDTNGVVEISPNRLLKCRRSFEHMMEKTYEKSAEFEREIMHGLGSLSCNVTICHALFEFLSTGFDAAADILQNATERHRTSFSQNQQMYFDPQRDSLMMDWEILTGNFIRLAKHQQKVSTVSSDVFRSTLIQGLRDFPDNPEFIRLLIRTESASFYTGRIRRYFDESLRDAVTVIPWVFAIFTEYERKYRLWKNLNIAYENQVLDDVALRTFRDTGISYKLRGVFERAVESDVGAHCPLLWRLYLRFEMEEDNLSRAEGIYYRGIQSCPWAKEVYMDAIRYFPQRTQEVVDIMTEKELRVFVLYDEAELLVQKKEELIRMSDLK